MMKLLSTTLLFMSVILCIAIGFAVHRGYTIRDKNNQIKDLEVEIQSLRIEKDQYLNIINAYNNAEKESKEFEKEMVNDKTDNLDVVPADYILKQLRAD